MKIQPALVDQVQRATNGRMVLISADVGGVAKDLEQIDPGLKVRFAENGNPPFWAVYHESKDGRDTHLVLTSQATQGSTGVWGGLDQRIVQRVREIDPERGYDYAAELVAGNNRRKAEVRYEQMQKFSGIAEQAAHAVRKDLGDKSRVSVTRKP